MCGVADATLVQGIRINVMLAELRLLCREVPGKPKIRRVRQLRAIRRTCSNSSSRSSESLVTAVALLLKG